MDCAPWLQSLWETHTYVLFPVKWRLCTNRLYSGMKSASRESLEQQDSWSSYPLKCYHFSSDSNGINLNVLPPAYKRDFSEFSISFKSFLAPSSDINNIPLSACSSKAVGPQSTRLSSVIRHVLLDVNGGEDYENNSPLFKHWGRNR